MALKRHIKKISTVKLLFTSVLVAIFLPLQEHVLCHHFGNQSVHYIERLDLGNVEKHRLKRATQPPSGFFFPIAMYTVRHHRPANDRRRVRPETWEYRGQYFYGFRPQPNSNRRRAARLLAAGLPLLLAPLLSIIFSFPVIVPVAQMTTITGVPPVYGPLAAPAFGRKKRETKHYKMPPPEKSARLKELEIVSNYLHQVDYDEKQQSRVMVNYLQCNGLLSPDDHCLERLSCEFGDPANEDAPELERTVTSILLGHMLNNEFIPKPFKKRLKAAAVHGRMNSGGCSKYFCHYVDNNWDYTATYPQQKEPFNRGKDSPMLGVRA